MQIDLHSRHSRRESPKNRIKLGPIFSKKTLLATIGPLSSISNFLALNAYGMNSVPSENSCAAYAQTKLDVFLEAQ